MKDSTKKKIIKSLKLWKVRKQRLDTMPEEFKNKDIVWSIDDVSPYKSYTVEETTTYYDTETEEGKTGKP